MKKKSILFVCKHNVFRSRIAEAYAKEVSDYNIFSGGLFAPGGELMPIQKRVISKMGLKLSKPKSISFTELCEVDIVVIVADDIPSSLFVDERYGKKEVIVWNIPDVPKANSDNEVRKTINIIRENVIKTFGRRGRET